MRRREFIGCAAAMSLVPAQGTSAEPQHTAKKGVSQRSEKAEAKLKLTHPRVDIAIVCSHFEESLRFYHELLGLARIFRFPTKWPWVRSWRRAGSDTSACVRATH